MNPPQVYMCSPSWTLLPPPSPYPPSGSSQCTSPSILVHWFLKCWYSILNLPLDNIQFTLIHGPNIPGLYVILFFIVSDFTFTGRHIQNWVLFPLWPSYFILSGGVSNCPLVYPSSILDTCWPRWLIFWCHTFCFFILFMGFYRQKCWSGLSFPSPVNHIFPELFIITCPSWVILHGMAHSFIEFCNPFIIRL